ncbi:hypothetical protein F4780DRAFT_761149 [Xylariomycetidae sp. FL0641]|nr:hypothetical protein F4780DRAFT_761149 [Xylariomycetidae sp. FL0641]
MASAQTQSQSIAVPGQLLGPSSQFSAGAGVHLHEGQLYASVLGRVQVASSSSSSATSTTTPPPRTSTTSSTGPTKRLHRLVLDDDDHHHPAKGRRVVSVERGGARGNDVLPEVGSTVLCRVTRIQPRQATAAILVVVGQDGDDAVLDAPWQGVVRVQDVRATEKDRVKIYESFRPGDIVRAQVISLGDQANYYLSTASNELGVIMATSEAGNTMYPVSWKEYRDPETGVSESRKVAKPF